MTRRTLLGAAATAVPALPEMTERQRKALWFRGRPGVLSGPMVMVKIGGDDVLKDAYAPYGVGPAIVFRLDTVSDINEYTNCVCTLSVNAWTLCDEDFARFKRQLAEFWGEQI